MMSDAESSQSKQTALPGLDEPDAKPFVVSVTDRGAGMIDYHVLIEAMTRSEAEEIFNEEFQLYEVGVYDEDWEWEHEGCFARSNGHAKRITLARDRDYMKVYEVSPLGNDARVDSIEPLEDVENTRHVRQAKSEANKVKDD